MERVNLAMTLPTPNPKNLIGVSMLLLIAAAVFGFLNSAKVGTLRSEAATAAAARDSAEGRRLAQEKEIKLREQEIATATAKMADNESRVASAEAELIKMQTEKAELQTKLDAKDSEIRTLQTQVQESGAKVATEMPGAPSTVELQAQLEEARRQLESAEREKILLAEKLNSNQERTTQITQERTRRESGIARAGIRGTVLAVNQAYNFVVLNLGGRNGVEPNSEMLVLRGATLIGKIRISSVEPATAIGDILTSSLARGVQVQPGDIVIYAGANS